MTRAEMETALKRFGFDDTDPLDTWLNAGMWEFCRKHDWSFLIQRDNENLSTSSGLISWAPGQSTIQKIISIKIEGQNGSLTEVSYQGWDQQVDSITATGCPLIYRIKNFSAGPGAGDNLTTEVWPISTSADIVYLVYKAKEPVIGNNGPLYVPQELHYAIVLRAAVIALQAEDEDDRAATQLEAFNEMVASAISDDDRYGGPYFVKDVMNYGC